MQTYKDSYTLGIPLLLRDIKKNSAVATAPDKVCPCVVAISKIPIIVERERRSWKNKKRLTIVSECVRETGTLQNHRQIYNLNAK